MISHPIQAEYSIITSNEKIIGKVNVKSWKTLRDQRITKQDLDYSCGAASIATLLTEYYQRPTEEKEVLDILLEVNGQKGKASFADMEKALPKLGFRGVGLATSWEQLIALKIPVILYVKQRKQDHFTVVSGINEHYVKLSDPSLGNRILTRGQFKAIWQTRHQGNLKGKMLALLPLDKTQSSEVDKDFWGQPSVSHLPKERLTIRY